MKRKIWNKRLYNSVIAMICAAVLGGSLTGCAGGNDGNGSGKADDSDKTIEIFVYNAGYGIDWLYSVKDAFLEKNPEYNIVIKEQASADVIDTIIRSGPTSNTYDLMLTSGEWKSYIDKGDSILKGYDYILEPLDDVYDSTVEGEDVTFGEKMYDSYNEYFNFEVYNEESGEVEDHHFVVPWAAGLTGLFYNKTMFGDCGLMGEPRTTSELKEYCETIKNNGKTALIYASSVGYWEYLYNIWWGQYEGLQGYEDFYNVTKDGVISKDVLKQEGILESARVLQQLLDPDAGYSAELVASMDYTKAQASFLSGTEGAMLPCGDWLENEMKAYESKIKDELGLMKTPIISALSDKMSYWTLNESYSEAQANSANAAILADYDEKLRGLVDYVDGVIDALPEGTTEEDAEVIREARKINYSIGTLHTAVVPAYASAKEGAKEFLKFLATDEAIELYLDNSVNSSLPFDYDITQYAGYDKMSEIGKQKFEIYQDAVYLPFAANYKTVYAGGLSSLRKSQSTFESSFAAPNVSDRETAEDMVNNNLEYWNESRWNNMLKQAGLG